MTWARDWSRDCPRCRGTRMVCEDHPNRPWEIAYDQTCCVAAGAFCPDCAQPPPPPQRGPSTTDLFAPAPPAPVPVPVALRATVTMRGGPWCGWSNTAPLGPDDRPPPRLAVFPGIGHYGRTDTPIPAPDGKGGTSTVYQWQPAPAITRSRPPCTCGHRGCPNPARPNTP